LVLTRLELRQRYTHRHHYKRLMDRLQSVLNTAARLVHNSRKYDHISPLLRDLHWLRAVMLTRTWDPGQGHRSQGQGQRLGVSRPRTWDPRPSRDVKANNKNRRPRAHVAPESKKLLPRDAMHKRGLCRHAVSVCVSVCP